MQSCFDEVKKNFGFGCMRLPMKGKEVDFEETSKMLDMFLANGFNYFDTAHGYLDGQSEIALKKCLTSRYPREAYILTNKLSGHYIEKNEDIRPFFQKQLEACGVDYFDFYLMHALNANQYQKFTECNAFQVAQQLKNEGKIRHVGISFHDTPEVLEQILSEHPEIEVVQIQFNYADLEDPKVQSLAVYEVCRRHGKPVIVMEPVKGGALANLPEAAGQILDRLQGGSRASYAIRFAASFEGVAMVLSGMSSLEQMQDNLSYMSSFQPLTQPEQEAVRRAGAVLKNQEAIACTACRYCEAGCPMRIPIPDLFAGFNGKKQGSGSTFDYETAVSDGRGRASSCIGCLQCEAVCPQHLPVSALLAQVAGEFEAAHEA